MAAQAALIAETIEGMKKRIRREEDSSGSDTTIDQPTNRGNKLKKHARYIRRGQLLPADGLRVNKKKVNYAGYDRYIISRNPKRYDTDGDELEDDEEDEEADAAALEENPYGDIHLEELLKPLTSAAELPTHPSLSEPYRSNVLTEMAINARATLHKEQVLLWRMKGLMTRFRGDDPWVPCNEFETEEDQDIFGPLPEILAPPNTNPRPFVYDFDEKLPDAPNEGNGNGSQNTHDTMNGGILKLNLEHPSQEPSGTASDATAKASTEDVTMKDVTDRAAHENEDNIGNQKDPQDQGNEVSTVDHNNSNGTYLGELANGDSSKLDYSPANSHETKDPESLSTKQNGGPTRESLTVEGTVETKMEDINDASNHEDDDHSGSEEDSQPTVHRMTTRAQAQAASDKTVSSTHERSPSITSDASIPVDPLFLIPPSCRPDRDFDMHPNLAEDLRGILAMFVQKQEEVVRGAEQLYESLMKADRLKAQVLRWCKSDGHVGEMSDGEDWYDKDEWGLEEDLKKGIDEEELEAESHAKKTRRGRG
ncbi:MAG: hypothetical protein M1834_008121 [Cirrosporium novae-zelandiae]|nr:MAG: hypothetical protein M1834_008121 [Cirrosporium novae-zelandiae]